jgi:hypothetical protein
MQQRYKGHAGMGSRGKNSPRQRQDKATARKVRTPKLAAAEVPGTPSSKNPRKRNQKKNQREWHEEKRFKARKASRVPSRFQEH